MLCNSQLMSFLIFSINTILALTVHCPSMFLMTWVCVEVHNWFFFLSSYQINWNFNIFSIIFTHFCTRLIRNFIQPRFHWTYFGNLFSLSLDVKFYLKLNSFFLTKYLPSSINNLKSLCNLSNMKIDKFDAFKSERNSFRQKIVTFSMNYI